MDLRNTSQGFLVFSAHNSENIEFELCDNFDVVIGKWSNTTRVSPIFRLSEQYSAFDDIVLGKYLLFSGPIYPPKLEQYLSENHVYDLFLTLGLYNCLVSTDSDDLRHIIVEACREIDTPLEVWIKDDGFYKNSLTEIYTKKISKDNSDVLQRLGAFYRKGTLKDISAELSEFTALCSSSLTRSALSHSEINDVISTLADSIQNEILSCLADTSAESVNFYLSKANAALSRFGSQCFSGVYPLSFTECHFWYHSLLGTGIANIALFKLVKFIGKIFLKYPLDSKLKSAALNYGDAVKDLTRKKNSTIKFWKDIPIRMKRSDDLDFITIPYFSGRDGFLSDCNYISAPLKTINKCASEKWSLLTITHEMCHIEIKSALAILLPLDDADQNECEYSKERAIAIMNNDSRQAFSLLDRLRQLFLISMIGYASESSANEKNTTTVNIIEGSEFDLIDDIKYEIEEIMVHVLDFLIFYGGAPKNYVAGIWNTWSAIPDIDNRIENYIIRTMCALYSAKLDSSFNDIYDLVVNDVREGLALVSHDDFSYVDKAKSILIEKELLLKQALLTLNPIIKICRFVIFDDVYRLETQDGLIDRTNFPLNVLTKKSIKNPLKFIESSLSKNKNVDLESYYILTSLAFCLETE